jgi:hypothetical protein
MEKWIRKKCTYVVVGTSFTDSLFLLFPRCPVLGSFGSNRWGSAIPHLLLYHAVHAAQFGHQHQHVEGESHPAGFVPRIFSFYVKQAKNYRSFSALLMCLLKILPLWTWYSLDIYLYYKLKIFSHFSWGLWSKKPISFMILKFYRSSIFQIRKYSTYQNLNTITVSDLSCGSQIRIRNWESKYFKIFKGTVFKESLTGDFQL